MELIKRLREITGAGILDCRNALQECEQDLDKAIHALKKRGIAKAEKRAGRTASEGRIVCASTNSKAALIELNSETDFVARTDEFIGFAESLANKVLGDGPSAIDEESFQVTAKELSGKVGEKIAIRRAAQVEAKGGFVASYIHSNNKIGVVIAFDGDSSNASQSWPRDIAMHVAAADPLVLRVDQLDPDKIAKQKEIFLAQIENKPAQIQEKIVSGKLDKWYEEVCLLKQPFVKDDSLTVEAYIASMAGNSPVTIKDFKRFELGSEAI